MKNIIALILMLPIVILSCSEDLTVVGHWKLDSVKQNGEVRLDKGNEKSIEFYEDGTLISGRDGKKTPMTGNWVYDATAATLEMNSEGGNKDDGIYQVKELSKSNLTIEKDEIEVSMSRLEKSLID
ncbi:hypothetical protein N8987_05210 [Crocinitomix sp.]|nr:hypothetical protein [Crocinitomix sp.]